MNDLYSFIDSQENCPGINTKLDKILIFLSKMADRTMMIEDLSAMVLDQAANICSLRDELTQIKKNCMCLILFNMCKYQQLN